MACVKDNLREVMILSSPDIIFKVPNYCICDPVFERDYEKLKEEDKDIAEEKIEVILYYLAKNINIKIHATNKIKKKKINKTKEENNNNENLNQTNKSLSNYEIINLKLKIYFLKK